MTITLNSPIDVAAYLDWIGYDSSPSLDLATLTELQQLHMTAVPFENLDIALGDGVALDAATAVDKIVEGGRGGWCFEVNGAFAALLEALGFRVTLLGAAVLLSGPSRVIDHVALEVQVDQPYLVDVGFGESFTRPLALNRSGRQDGGNAAYEFIASPEGTTLARLDESGADAVPVAQYRFKRVAHSLEDFAPVSASMQVDPDKNWHKRPFATRLLDLRSGSCDAHLRSAQDHPRREDHRAADHHRRVVHHAVRLVRHSPRRLSRSSPQTASWISTALTLRRTSFSSSRSELVLAHLSCSPARPSSAATVTPWPIFRPLRPARPRLHPTGLRRCSLWAGWPVGRSASLGRQAW